MNQVGTKIGKIDVGKMSQKDAMKHMQEIIKKYSNKDFWWLLV